MFDAVYTKNYLKKLEKDYNILNLVLTSIALVISLVYPIFAIVVGLGNLYINISLLSLTVLYLTVYLIFTIKQSLNKNKAIVKSIYKYSHNIISLVAIFLNVYNIYIAATNVNGIGILITVLMIISWILKFIINITYDILVPRITTLYLCMKEDSKPTAKYLDMITNKPVFEYWKEDIPQEVIKAMHGTTKISETKNQKEFNKELKESFLNNNELNKNEIIGLDELINTMLTNEHAIVNKQNFIYEKFSKYISNSKKLKKFVNEGPLSAGLNVFELREYVDQIVNENSKNVEEIQKYIHDNTYMISDEKQYMKVMKLFLPILQTMEKIIYIYGFKQPTTDPHKNKLVVQALLLAYPIVTNDVTKEEAIEGLMKLKKIYWLAEVKNKFTNNGEINFDSIKSQIDKSIPLLQTILDNFTTSKAGLYLGIAKKVIDIIPTIKQQINK